MFPSRSSVGADTSARSIGTRQCILGFALPTTVVRPMRVGHRPSIGQGEPACRPPVSPHVEVPLAPPVPLPPPTPLPPPVALPPPTPPPAPPTMHACASHTIDSCAHERHCSAPVPQAKALSPGAHLPSEQHPAGQVSGLHESPTSTR